MLKTQATAILAALAALSAIAQPKPETQLVWSTDHLEANTTATQASADYNFGVTNISDSEVVINNAIPSCSCTSAQLPSKPWCLLPHTGGEIKVSVNLAGKMGTFDKTVAIYFADTNMPRKILRVTVKMPDRKEMRDENMKIALADRQAVSRVNARDATPSRQKP